MRPGPGKFVAVAALTVLAASATAGCGSSGGKPDLMKEYLEASEVGNDTFRGEGENSEEVKAALAVAAESEDVSTTEVVRAVILWAYSCDTYYNGPRYPSCSPGGEADEAIADAAGSDGTTHARSLLVKRDNGSLELVTVYVVRGDTKDAVLIDTTGRTYTGGLADFRANNELLDADDWMLAPADITEIPEPDEIPLELKTVTVPGHTPGTWGWWAAGAGIVLLLLLGVLWLNWTPRARTSGPDNVDSAMKPSL